MITKEKKTRARAITRYAIKKGVLTRRPCEVCGNLKSQAHHPNYINPYKIKWLCFEHHIQVHKHQKSSMPFSVKPVQSTHTAKDGLRAVSIQVICNRIKIYVPTDIRVTENQFDNGIIVKHPIKDSYNLLLGKRKAEAERRLIDLKLKGSTVNKDVLLEAIKGESPRSNLKFVEFIYQVIDENRNKLSPGRIRHYESMVIKILTFHENVLLADINAKWLQSFETFLFEKKLAQNTISTNMKIIKSFINKADEKGLTDSRLMKGYKTPRYIQPEIDYLNEDELTAFYNLVKTIAKPGHKLAGYYFLFSCFTGLRISDARTFKYEKMVVDDTIFLRAKKNKKMIAIPIYPELREVLEFVKLNEFYLSEQKTNEYIKDIASLAGIKKRIYYHISRHTAASRFLRKGFSMKEVAYIIGDSRLVAEVYAHLDTSHIKKRFVELLG